MLILNTPALRYHHTVEQPFQSTAQLAQFSAANQLARYSRARLCEQSPRNVPRVILNAGAVTHFFLHLQFILSVHIDASGVEHFSELLVIDRVDLPALLYGIDDLILDVFEGLIKTTDHLTYHDSLLVESRGFVGEELEHGASITLTVKLTFGY